MNGSWLGRVRTAIAGAIGVAILMGAPLPAQADQGKWWKPKEGDRKSEQSDRGGQDRGNRGGQRTWNRGDQGAWRGGSNNSERFRSTWRDRADQRVQVRDRWNGGGSGDIRFRDRRYSARGRWGGTSVWRGDPVRRDVLVIRDRRYGGGYFRARRIYCAPRYYGRFVYVRPVRFFVAANLRMGGVHIGARIVRPHYLYGCNFCDERFDTYGAYAYHVEHCAHRPSGFAISVSNWDDDFDSYWDGPYQATGYYDDQGYNDDPYYDDSYDDEGYYHD